MFVDKSFYLFRQLRIRQNTGSTDKITFFQDDNVSEDRKECVDVRKEEPLTPQATRKVQSLSSDHSPFAIDISISLYKKELPALTGSSKNYILLDNGSNTAGTNGSAALTVFE